MNSKTINIALWTAQVLVAFMFFFAFYAKLLQPVEETAKTMPWVAEQPALAMIAGIADLLGALGLILPAALRIQPKLTILAAYGGGILMVAAIVFHLMRGEAEVIGLNFILMALLAFIIWGRTKKAPITAKT